MEDQMHGHEHSANPPEISSDMFWSLYRTVNGNGQPGVVQKLDRIIGYVERQEGMEAARRGARARAKWVFGLVLTVFLALTGWGFNHLWAVVEPPAAAIIKDYWEHHPEARGLPQPQQKNSSGIDNSAYSMNRNAIRMAEE